MPYTTDAARWRALSTRDPASNNHFVYTVRSTRVYCRPICPARLARRANVGFCSTPAEAAAAGFRACKRCKPDEGLVGGAQKAQEDAVAKACAIIESALRKGDAQACRLRAVAGAVGLTPRYFHKVFKDRVGCTPAEWAKRRVVEMEKGREEISRTPSLVLDSPTEWASMDLEGLRFDELVDFGIAEGDLSVDDIPDSMVAMGTAMPTMGDLDYGMVINTSMADWNTCVPRALDPGLGFSNDSMSAWADVAITSERAIPMASTTFEQDAALILSSDYMPELGECALMDRVG